MSMTIVGATNMSIGLLYNREWGKVGKALMILMFVHANGNSLNLCVTSCMSICNPTNMFVYYFYSLMQLNIKVCNLILEIHAT